MKLSPQEKAARRAAFLAMSPAKKREHIWEYYKWPILLGLLALLILWLGLPSARVLRFAARLLWAAGAFLAGRRCGLHGRRFGLWEGALCGALLWALWICGALLFRETPDRLWIPALLLPVSGACGGILGVNTKLRKAPD